MKSKRIILQAVSVFPPALALLVSLSLFARSRQEDVLSKWLALSHDIFVEVLEMNACARDFVDQGDSQSKQQWELRYANLGQEISELYSMASEGARHPIPSSLRMNYDNIRVILSQIEQLKKLRAAAPDDRAKIQRNMEVLMSHLKSRAQSVATSSLQLVHARYMDALAVQQMADSIVIILSSLLAVAMTIGAYFAVKEEMTEREKVGEKLRKSDIMLSDAFLKLKRASEQVVHQERVSTLSQITRWVTHECRNGLTAVVTAAGFLRLSHARGGDIPDLPEALKSIEQGAACIETALERLSRFLRAEKISEKASVDMSRVVLDTVEMTSEKWKERPSWAPIAMETDLDEVPLIEGRESDLCELIVHLISNAVEAMPNGGKIICRTRAMGEWVGIEVVDTGIGMTDEVGSRCFEPFFSTKGSGAAGMGMTIVQGIVKQHQGTLDIETAPAKGTTVVMCFPRKQHRDLPGEKPVGISEPVRKLKILVVDDESWSRIALLHMLTTDRHDVETAVSGRDGLNRFRRQKFDVVFTDHAMPDMSGEELAIAIKQISSKQPVVMVSGFDDVISEETRRKGLVGAVVHKPVKIEELRKAISAVGEWRTGPQTPAAANAKSGSGPPPAGR